MNPWLKALWTGKEDSILGQVAQIPWLQQPMGGLGSIYSQWGSGWLQVPTSKHCLTYKGNNPHPNINPTTLSLHVFSFSLALHDWRCCQPHLCYYSPRTHHCCPPLSLGLGDCTYAVPRPNSQTRRGGACPSPTHHHQWTGHQDPSCYLGSYPPITVFLTLPAFPTTRPCEFTFPVPQAVPTVHYAELDQPHCDMCLAYCKEPGGPFNNCNCCTTAISPPPLPIPLGDEIVHCMGTVSADAGGAQERSHISPIEPHNTPLV